MNGLNTLITATCVCVWGMNGCLKVEGDCTVKKRKHSEGKIMRAEVLLSTLRLTCSVCVRPSLRRGSCMFVQLWVIQSNQEHREQRRLNTQGKLNLLGPFRAVSKYLFHVCIKAWWCTSLPFQCRDELSHSRESSPGWGGEMRVWLKSTAGRYLCVRSGSWKWLARARADKASSFMAKAINITVMSWKHVALLCLTPQQCKAEVFQSE